jgi:hypothetical protein
MTPKEIAIQIVDKHRTTIRKADIYGYLLSDDEIYLAKESALITVIMIMSANPHSNPFNTDVYSTMKHWEEVRKEIELL